MRYIIFILLMIGGLWSVLSVFDKPLGAVAVKEISDKTIIDYSAFAIFENNAGEQITVPFTKEEHNALNQKNAPMPQLDGYTWKQSGLIPIYANTTLQNNQYFKVGVDGASTTQVKVRASDKEGVIPITDIVDGVLTPEGLSKLQ